MCLRTDLAIEKKYLKKWENNNEVYVYKAFKVRNVLRHNKCINIITGPYKTDFEYKPGTTTVRTRATYKFGDLKSDWKKVHIGIHVFLNYDDVFVKVNQSGNDLYGCKIAKLKIHKDDISSIGRFGSSDSAVLNKLTLTKKQYKRLISK